jgi:23S rRNA (guanosine2251-2'-O)-methyltransferase
MTDAVTDSRHPRDRFITVYGRKPVIELLEQENRTIRRIVLDVRARGPIARKILELAAARGGEVERGDAALVTKLSRNAKQDQGVAADVEAPRMASLSRWLSSQSADATLRLWMLDGVTNASNVGMILRSAVACGVGGVVLPRRGCPEVGPMVIKASAGMAYEAPVLRVATVKEAISLLEAHGVTLVGLTGASADALDDVTVPARCAIALGNETSGLSTAVLGASKERWRIPMAPGAESLNVAVAAAVVGFEIARRDRIAR